MSACPTFPVASRVFPLGEYLGDIQSATYQETDKPGKFDQIKVTYVVVDGELLGKIQSEWLSLSPKAAFRLKKWFAKFPGLDDGAVDDLEFDDADGISEPDIVGTRVIFKVYQERDKRVADETADDAYSIKATLVSVEDDGVPAPKAKATPVEDAEDPKAAKRAELAAQLAALEDDGGAGRAGRKG